jgi:hypothetical protein
MQLEKNRLVLLPQLVQFSSNLVSIFWHLDKSGFFMLHSLYKFLNSGDSVFSYFDLFGL